MSTVAETSSEPARTALVDGHRRDHHVACAERPEEREALITVHNSLQRQFQLRVAEQLVPRRRGDDNGKGGRSDRRLAAISGLSSPSAVANSAIFAAETWYGSLGG